MKSKNIQTKTKMRQLANHFTDTQISQMSVQKRKKRLTLLRSFERKNWKIAKVLAKILCFVVVNKNNVVFSLKSKKLTGFVIKNGFKN